MTQVAVNNEVLVALPNMNYAMPVVPVLVFCPFPFLNALVSCPCVSHVVLQVAINNEVMVAISNMNYAMPGGMLTTWIEGIKRAGVRNAMVVALDAQTKRLAEEHGVTAHEMHLEVGLYTKPPAGTCMLFLAFFL